MGESGSQNITAGRVALLSIAALFFSYSPLRADIINGIVGTIDTTPVTMLDLILDAKIDRILNGTKPLTSPLTRSEALETANRLRDHYLILKEITTFPTGEPVDNDIAIEKLIASFKAYFDTPATMREFIDEFELTETTLRALMAKRYAITEYIRRRVVVFINTSPAEIAVYYKKNPQEFGGRTLEDATGEIQKILFKIKYSLRYREVIIDLGRRISAQFYLDSYPYVDIFKDKK